MAQVGQTQFYKRGDEYLVNEATGNDGGLATGGFTNLGNKQGYINSLQGDISNYQNLTKQLTPNGQVPGGSKLYSYANGSNYQGVDPFQQLTNLQSKLSEAQAGQGQFADNYNTGSQVINGNFTTKQSIDQENQYKAGVASGQLKAIDMGNGISGYVPSQPLNPADYQTNMGNQNNTSQGGFPNMNLQPGSKDSTSVKALQDYLVKSGYMTQAQVNTGYGTYGPQTTRAVAELQKKMGVDNSTGVGYFGPRTIGALGSSIGGQMGAISGSNTSTPSIPQSLNTPPTSNIPPSTSTTAPTTGNGDDLAKQYAALLGKSPEEIAAQKAIDDTTNAGRQGQFNVSQAPIAQSFISGQQAAMQTQENIAKIPLQQQLANAQARRQTSLDSLRFQIERADKKDTSIATATQQKFTNDNVLADNARADKTLENTINKPMKVSAGATVYDPKTGKPVYTAPKTANPKSSSTTFKYTKQDQAEDTQALESSRGTDNYVNPTTYQNLYKAWIASGGGVKDFLTKYPPKNYVNPDNPWLPTFLMPAKKAGEASNPFK